MALQRRRSSAELEIAASAAAAPQPPATGELAPGVVTRLSERVRRIVAPNPSLMTGPGTDTYLVGVDGGELAVIDPGPADEGHLDRVAEVGGGAIRWILVTHTHADHSPGAPGLSARTGAPTVGLRKTIQPTDRHDAADRAGGDRLDPDEVADGAKARDRGDQDDFAPDIVAGDGWSLALDGPVPTALRALHTPGHASNHLCWLLDEEVVLFSGDHVMDGSTVVIAPPDGDMAAYLDQLERLRALGLHAIAPGHGRLITDPDARLDEYLHHRRAREAQVLAGLGPEPRTVEDLVAAIYAETPDALRPVARFSVWAHLRKLRADGAAASDHPDDVAGTWVSTTG